MLHLKKNLLVLFLFLPFSIFTDINKNPFELIDIKSQEMVVVLTAENELFKTNPELFKNKIKNIESMNIDTFDINNNFFSARRALRLNHDDYGRNISIIMLN